MNKSNVLLRGIARYFSGIAIMSVLLFTTAGTFMYPYGWLFLAAFFIPDLAILIYLGIKDREFLEKRLRLSEKEKAQKIFNIIYYCMSFSLMAFSGLNYRFGWQLIPMNYSLIGVAFVLGGFVLSFLAMKQNRYAARTVEIQKDHKLIDTGLYSVIRHPMYLSALLIFVPTPLVLGSLYSFLIGALLMPAVLIFRILNEEKILKRDLPGYAAYMTRVKYRVIPFVW